MTQNLTIVSGKIGCADKAELTLTSIIKAPATAAYDLHQ